MFAFGGSEGIRAKVFLAILVVAFGLGTYYRFIYPPAQASLPEVAYVLARSVEVFDSTAEIRTTVTTVPNGEKLEVLEHSRSWAKVRLPDGRRGWVETRSLLDAESFEDGKRLFESLPKLHAQAAGHAANVVNLHLEPLRESPQLGQLKEREKVEIFRRRMVERTQEPTREAPSTTETPAAGSSPREAWYLLRAGSKAGWALGRLIALDIPENISRYAQDTNVVAWLVLNTVDDSGQPVPQYLIADRLTSVEFDFDHIRVLTWWKKNHRYVIAYVESNLNGYFPMRVSQINGVPYFRLRMVDAEGRKVQKVYGLFDVIARPLGYVTGWETEAVPGPHAGKPKAAPRRRRGRAHLTS